MLWVFCWRDRRGAHWVFLGYCGEALDTRFPCLEHDFKYVCSFRALYVLSERADAVRRVRVISAFVEIHNAGVAHNDVSERNVLDRDGIPLVIDFEDATEEECERKMDVGVNNIRPHPQKFGCRELFALADELGLWKPGQCGPRWAQNGSDD